MRLYTLIFYNNSKKQMTMDPQAAVVFPYIYGSMAFSLGKKSEPYTHKWICYVRGVNNQDLSYLINRVQFQLHSSFDNPIKKAISKPPYQIQQLGWGQFQILIRVHFNHPDMPCIQVPHMLKLHSHTAGTQANKKPLCSEVYDQIVFLHRDQHIDKIIENKSKMQIQSMIPENQGSNEQIEIVSTDQPLKSITRYSKYYSEIKPEENYSRLDEAFKFINYEIRILEEKMRNTDADITKVYQQIYPKH